MTTSSENDKEPEPMPRLIRRSLAIAVVSIAISLFVSAVPAAQAAPVNCTRQTHKGGCYEFVWVNGVQVRMTFPQAGNPLPTIPNAKVQNFYVIAQQTDTPQGDLPANHDHTIQAAPGDPGWTPFMHGYFVVCSAAGLASDKCVAVESDFPGFGILQLAQSVNGQPLTSAETIEAGIRAGLLIALDTSAVFVGNISPAR